MDLHYCQDRLKGISFVGKAKTCHEKLKCSCHVITLRDQTENLTQAENKICCHSESIVIEKSDLDATNSLGWVEHGLQLNLKLESRGIDLYFINAQSDFQLYVQYKPPLPDRVTQALYQTFLI